MGENNGMTSIARKINMEFWLQLLSAFFVIDIVLLAMGGLSFFLWMEGRLPEGAVTAGRYFIGSGFEKWQYVIETEGGQTCSYYLNDLFAIVKLPAAVLLATEALLLLEGMFQTRKVRKLMRPLNDIAVKTEQLAKLDFDSAKMQNFEKAVSSLDPENPDAKVFTGDQDLQSLEIAINNLLGRMRESHQQQDRFVSDASHELRTPISVIQGYANMLDRWGKEDAQILEEGITAIKNEAEHMETLIEQLLFLARGDSGRNTLEFADIDLGAIVQDVFEESEMIDTDHIYRLDIGGPVPMQGDAAMLKQSLRILVQNAAKYSGSGSIITLQVQILDGRPVYRVQDEGIGMEESEVVHVFERFYRADAARNREEAGSGLGLSIAKWIIDAHKGEIQILSRPEFGTRFTVKF